MIYVLLPQLVAGKALAEEIMMNWLRESALSGGIRAAMPSARTIVTLAVVSPIEFRDLLTGK